LLAKQQELMAKNEDVLVLKEQVGSLPGSSTTWISDIGVEYILDALQLELERKLRALLSKEKEKAEEEAALAMGLCTGGAMLP
jgi:hypothetical protein